MVYVHVHVRIHNVHLQYMIDSFLKPCGCFVSVFALGCVGRDDQSSDIFNPLPQAGHPGVLCGLVKSLGLLLGSIWVAGLSFYNIIYNFTSLKQLCYTHVLPCMNVAFSL